jgi:Cu(I)/Ag(I) efflux system membrane fusion protein
MSFVRWALVVVAAVVAAFSIASYAGIHPGGSKSAPRPQLYTCPMHPAIVQDHPGECPICGMTLVPKLDGVAPSPGVAPSSPGKAEAPVPGLANIDLPPGRVQLMGMRTSIVKRAQIAGDLRTVGVVAANERGLAQITIRFAGWIEKLLVSETGEHVRRGQVLATVYSPDVLRAEQELLVTRGWGGQGDVKGLEETARRRLELLGISGQEIDEVLRVGKAPDAIAIRSPVDGTIVGKNAVVGLAIQPGTVLFQVADLSTVWVTADVHESDVSRVHIGQTARFEPSSSAGEPQNGKVKFIYPIVDAQSRSLTVRLELKNRFDRSGPKLRPGMYGNVYLALPATTGLMVPREAVVDTGEAHYLFVAKEGGHFEPRLVKIGARQDDAVEILSGVSEGETVVTTGNFLVDSESRLQAAIRGQASSDGASSAAAGGSTCAAEFDGATYPDKFRACRACEVQHRGMGTMEEDCKKTIPKPWR